MTILIILRTRLRWLGLLPLLLGFTVGEAPPAPDFAISQDGRAVAILDERGELFLPYPNRAKFMTQIWQRAWSGNAQGDRNPVAASCDRDLCQLQSPQGVRIAIVYSPERIEAACGSSDLLFAPRLRWVRCQNKAAPKIFKRVDFDRHGTMLFHFSALEESSGRTHFLQNHNPETSSGTILLHSDARKIHYRVQTSLRQDNRPWNRARIHALKMMEETSIGAH